MLSLSAVCRTVAGRALVDRVSFDLAAGEVLAVLGPSGSGKTSLLRLVAGFDAPSAGSIRWMGRPASEAHRVLMAPEHRSVAVAFQDATLFAHLDAVGNTAFAIRSGDRASRRQQARLALQAMGLTDTDGRNVATLSGGEAQRVSLARALAADARLLLLDEPFGNVDRLTRADLMRRLKARLGQGGPGRPGQPGRPGPAALIITHDPADAIELGARVLLMRDGQVVADGPPQALLAGEQGDWARAFLQAT